jgi:type I restriction enzyme S subunit
VPFVSSPLGQVPKGWEVKKLSETCEIVMGQSPKSEFYNETGEGLPFHQGVTDFGDRFPTDRVYCTVENRVAEKGDVLFSVRAPVGRINITTRKIVIGRGLSAIRSRTGNQVFLFHQLKARFQEEDTMGGGTIFKAVTKDEMQGIELIGPPAPLIEKFEEIAAPMSRQVENLTARNAKLRGTRDLLLPRLVSSEVDVSELDIKTGGNGG